ncbi:hypothetical protein [Ruegeria faecimaris]|uniref:hypothetical protein n=1 Tax=Ruegeria faecimaris TaxID=686389 RepID=UPI002491EDB9|nr:hypothetical protein [Ruegeria faecimaris]
MNTDRPTLGRRLSDWWHRTFVDLVAQLQWSYMPPLMVYFAAGVSGLTSVVGAFFLKDYLNLSAAFVAGLAFWAGLPWILKMPLGHLVDLFWRWKSLLILVGASLITASLLIMYGLVTAPAQMAGVMLLEHWYVVALILAPSGYAIQDVVADAMTVEAVPQTNQDGFAFTHEEVRARHTTMQTLGRIAIISGFAGVAAVNIWIFSGAEDLDKSDRLVLYGQVYLVALVVPLLSISGVVLHALIQRRLVSLGHLPHKPDQATEVRWPILLGGLAFVVLSVVLGTANFAFAQETVFAVSLTVILYLMSRLLRELESKQAKVLIGTATIIFVFRAVPLPGPGLTWFEIDELGFDEQFLAILALLTSLLALLGLIILRPFMASRSIAQVVVLLTIAAGVLALPNLALYYGVHEWTAAHTGGVVDARFIAILDTAVESPLGQIAMVPMLAWIARNAPTHLKATFFAVMASFTNMALSASSLGTKYLNQVFVVTRVVTEPRTGSVASIADYSHLGNLLITVGLISVIVPLIMVFLVQNSPYRTGE